MRTDGIRRWVQTHRAASIAVGVALVLLLLSLRRFGGSKAAPPPPERRVPVAVETARTGDISEYLDGIGTVTARAMVTVRSRVDGELMAVNFREGQRVRSGDLLAQIDPRPFQVQLEQAQGQLTRDQALLANAKVDLQRYRALAKEDAVPTQQRDTQEALVRQFEAALVIDQGQIDAAKLNLVYSRITSPVDGRIGLRLVDPGNIVHAADAGGLAVVTQLRPIDVVFTIPEDELPPVLAKVHAGERLEVDAFDRERHQRLAEGTLLTVDNAIDTTTGTVRLKAEFPNGEGKLYPNQFVNVRMVVDTIRDTVVIPSAALQRDNQGTIVYTVKEDSTVAVRRVKPGPADGEVMSIESGLQEGERVVVDGVDRIREGAKVEVVQPGVTPGTRPPGAAGAGRERGQNLTPEQREAYKKKMEAMTPEERQEFRKRREAQKAQ